MEVKNKVWFTCGYRSGKIAVRFVLYLNVALLISCSSSDSGTNPPPPPYPMPDPVSQPLDYSSWTISDLSDSLSVLNVDEFMYMNESSMQSSFIELEVGENLVRNSNSDEIYYFHLGGATLEIDAVEVNAEIGDIISVGASTQVQFTNVSSTLQVVVVSMKASSSTNPAWQKFSKSTIETPRNSNSNVWNPFMNYSNVILGLYMLPQTNGGDGRLVHTWEELNIVTSGNSKFKMDTDEVDLDNGSIVFVKNGNGHFFRSPTSDIDILIFWEQP